jgi:alpha-L-fucosidase 2
MRTIHLFFPCVLFFAAGQICGGADKVQTDIDVYLLAGQSNATGQGYVSNLTPERKSPTRVLLFHSGKPSLDCGNESCAWSVLHPASESPDRFGPELGFGNRMQSLRPDRTLTIIKHAYSGTSLFQDWKPGKKKSDRSDWGPHYATFVDTVEQGLQGLRERGYRPVLRGMLWQQGENDADTTETALQYASNLTHFIDRVREQFDAPDLAFVYGYVLPPPNTGEGRDIVRKAQRDLDSASGSPLAIRGASVVETDDLSHRANDPNTPYDWDHIHFGTNGIWDLGVRMAERMNEMETQNTTPMELWYGEPALDWSSQALPIGNGRLGGMLFGGIEREFVQFNEDSLWTGDESDCGSYQNFGNLIIDLFGTKKNVADYRRSLDIRRAVHRVSYTLDGVPYTREAFCSYPAGVMVLRFSADRPGAYSGRFEMQDAHETQSVSEGDTVSFAGALSNGMKYEARARVVCDGGTVRSENNGLHIENANGFTVYLAAGTDYSNRRDKGWRGEAPHARLANAIEKAIATPYDRLLLEHEQDYTALFGRFDLDLGKTLDAQRALPTDRRILKYRLGNTPDPELETLFLQYGRYLLVSSSRPGGLPANLQGVWNNSNTPPWRCDYHSNINIEMNYWLAEPTNLSECNAPLMDYFSSIREVRKEQTQAHYTCSRGWTVQTENNIFGASGWRWNPPGSAWYAQHVWERYAFCRDKEFLRETAYPILKEVSQFWEDRLIELEDGSLATPDGWSPEHGPEEPGVTYDQMIVWDLFSNTIDAASELGDDPEFRERLVRLRDRLLAPKIGSWGQLQEWRKDIDDRTDQHRHVSHLFGLHPGRQISPETTPELAKAACVSLNARGDWGTGWSRAWKMNFWARLHDGNHAYLMLHNLLTPVAGFPEKDEDGNKTNAANGDGGIGANLFDMHPPFQIDGNFGATAGVSEMLLQSHLGELHLLPALPDAWPTGHVLGIRARGGFELDIDWEKGMLHSVTIRSIFGGPCRIRYADRSIAIDTARGGVYRMNKTLESM